MVAQALLSTRRRLGKISDGAAILDCDPKTVRRWRDGKKPFVSAAAATREATPATAR